MLPSFIPNTSITAAVLRETLFTQKSKKNLRRFMSSLPTSGHQELPGRIIVARTASFVGTSTAWKCKRVASEQLAGDGLVLLQPDDDLTHSVTGTQDGISSA